MPHVIASARLVLWPVHMAEAAELHALLVHEDVRRYLTDEVVMSRAWGEGIIRKKTGRDRRPPSRTPQDVAIWIWAVFVWYCAFWARSSRSVRPEKRSAPALSGYHNPASCAESFWKKRDTIDSRRCADALLSAAAPPPCRTLRITTGERGWEE
jgi:hypothetical protein